MNKRFWIGLLVWGLPLKVLAASCTVDNGAFNLAVSRGDYPSALKLVFDTLKVSSKDRARFHIE